MEKEEEGEEEFHLSPSKRLKTLISALTPSAPPSSLKGKEKIAAMASPESVESPSSEGEICGICLSEAGGSIRGRIDSCDHHFCFVCIMEWSKVESRCPMCKQRFGSIRRPPVRGVFLRERVVRVPVRNQVDHHETAASADPYAEVNCSECQKSVDENLLLLCDLCDSAAHTYCVGLGATVPEGDWFCPDCTITRNEHSKLEMEDDPCTQDSPKVFTGHCHDSLPVSISDIVSDEFSDGSSHRFSNMHLTRTGRSYDYDTLASRGDTAQNEAQHSLRSSSLLTQKTTSSGAKVSEQGTRTLRRCRDVHDHIRRLRENWDALRNGSLSFTTRHVDLGKMDDDGKQQMMCANSSTSRQVQTLRPSKPEQLPTENDFLDNKLCCTSSQDVVRAWKMMEVAKSTQKTLRGNVLNYPASSASNCIARKYHPRENRDLNSGFVVQKCKSAEDIVCEATGSGLHHFKSQTNERKKTCNITIYERFPKQKESVATNSSKSCNGLKSAPVTVSHGRKQEKTSHQILSKESILIEERDVPACSRSVTYDKTKHVELSKSKRKLPKVNLQMDKNADESSSKTINDTKSEVQSLVKLNLKLQLINHQLGGDKFKEVARVATHTILAACGLEHSKSSARSFPSLICKHPEQVKNQHRSNLMPSSCQQCFFSFVREVVSSALSEKAAPTEHKYHTEM